MNKAFNISLVLGLLNLFSFYNIRAQLTQMSTYCNPVNLDYTYMIYNAHDDISYRSGADPAVVKFKDEYYMFVTRSMGYWHSTDLNNWTFIFWRLPAFCASHSGENGTVCRLDVALI